MNDKFNALLEDGVIKKNKSVYNLYRGDEKVFLGMGEAKARQKLESLLNEGNVEGLEDKTANKQEVVTNPTGNHKVDNLSKKESVKLESLLDLVQDINPNSDEGTDLDITIDGVDSRLIDNPVIKAFPLNLYWRKKNHSVDNGSGNITNRQYTVVDKNWHQLKDSTGKYRIQVKRDDSPKASFFSVGDLVLCACKRNQYLEKKQKQVARTLLRSKVSEETRNEKAKQISKSVDVGSAMNMLDSVNSEGRRTQSEHLQKNVGLSATDAMRRIERISGDEAVELAKML